MHIPAFPPTWEDFHPGDPNEGLPPLPMFLLNPRPALPLGMTHEQYREIVDSFGLWATNRAIAMLPHSSTREQVERAARDLYEVATARLRLPVGIG